MANILKTNRRTTTRAFQDRQEFDNSTGSLRGRWIRDGRITRTGQLPDEYLRELRTALSRGDVFVVWSYETPIAWVEADTGTVTKPGIRYSQTTSCHQGLLY